MARSLVRSIHHAALFTADYAATAAFYAEVFDAEAPAECQQPSVLHVGGATLHVFEAAGIRADWEPARLHHLGLMAADLPAFSTIRDRLMARGATDGAVQDFGLHLGLLASDPDGGMLEVMLPEDAASGTLPFAVRPH